jgi:hypothetical protein
MQIDLSIMSNRYPQYLILLFVLLAGLNSCESDKGTDPCKTIVAPDPPTANLVFRLFDAVTHEDLYLTSQPNKLNPDSFSASQPCSPYNPLICDAHIYNIPAKTGLPKKQGYVFKFLNLRDPSMSELSECYSIVLHWNKNDSDIVFWSTILHPNGDCPPYQVLQQVYFNGIPVQPVYDTAYQYYPLYR